jgi:hypothetical protein
MTPVLLTVSVPPGIWTALNAESVRNHHQNSCYHCCVYLHQIHPEPHRRLPPNRTFFHIPGVPYGGRSIPILSSWILSTSPAFNADYNNVLCHLRAETDISSGIAVLFPPAVGSIKPKPSF